MQDWEAVRPTFERLYAKEELKDVMNTMAKEYGFYAT
jgi:hypothetical protein